ncbi:MAG: TIGR01459 family HAD-type hydrolase, partial [Pseudomonadota bacterium]|nr:TIGR01459 family HAD-type hydrolase [Pseudomonadota bacterium]
KVLAQLGVTPELYDYAVTSGEMGYRALRTDTPWGRRYYYIGPSKDADVLDGLEYQRVDDVKTADFLLNVGFGSEEESSENWQMLLCAARGRALPMLCLNPDFEVVKITGERYACAGVLAADYEKMGGTVKYFGKPFPEIYEYCMELLFPSPREREKKKILAIGDGIVTDIAGAVSFGIDAALVTGGIIKKDEHKVEGLCRKVNAVPNYVMPALVW